MKINLNLECHYIKMLRYLFNFLIITIYIYISLFIVYEKYNQKIYVCNKYAKRVTLEIDWFWYMYFVMERNQDYFVILIILWFADTIRYLSLHDNKYIRYFPGHTKKWVILFYTYLIDRHPNFYIKVSSFDIHAFNPCGTFVKSLCYHCNL